MNCCDICHKPNDVLYEVTNWVDSDETGDGLLGEICPRCWERVTSPGASVAIPHRKIELDQDDKLGKPGEPEKKIP